MAFAQLSNPKLFYSVNRVSGHTRYSDRLDTFFPRTIFSGVSGGHIIPTVHPGLSSTVVDYSPIFILCFRSICFHMVPADSNAITAFDGGGFVVGNSTAVTLFGLSLRVGPPFLTYTEASNNLLQCVGLAFLSRWAAKLIHSALARSLYLVTPFNNWVPETLCSILCVLYGAAHKDWHRHDTVVFFFPKKGLC